MNGHKLDWFESFDPNESSIVKGPLRIGITERGDGGLEIDKVLGKMKQVDGAIIITKAPQLLLDRKLPDNMVIHATITGLGGTRWEPGVPQDPVTLKAYQALPDRYGPERVVLRVDPILPTDAGLPTALRILEKAKGRVRISFLDLYPHVKERILASGISALPWKELHAPLAWRQNALEQIIEIQPGVEICGEPNIPCTGCVSNRDIKAMGLKSEDASLKGQRPMCQCLGAKVELLDHKGQCPHGCVYCYWR